MTGALGFEQVIEEHQAMVFRTLTRLVGSPERVPDLAQEVFLRLYRALPRFRGEAAGIDLPLPDCRECSAG